MSQEKLILEHLKSGKSITPIEALNLYGCFRLSGRIKDLRYKDHDIESKLVEGPNGKHFCRYSMPLKSEVTYKQEGKQVCFI